MIRVDCMPTLLRDHKIAMIGEKMSEAAVTHSKAIGKTRHKI